jgi:uncharacterized protein (DUF1501 family)
MRALEVERRLAALETGARAPEERGYTSHPLSLELAEVATLARADVGLEVACVDHDGWDTHFVQGTLLPDLASTLASALATFRDDLGDRFAETTVLVLSEFGRRAYENTSLGTDHGRGGVALVLGGAVAGGRVLAEPRPLDEASLEPPGDWPVTIDYRDLLAEIATHLGASASAVTPGHAAVPRGVFRRSA